jgi:hypothetical protein
VEDDDRAQHGDHRRCSDASNPSEPDRGRGTGQRPLLTQDRPGCGPAVPSLPATSPRIE